MKDSTFKVLTLLRERPGGVTSGDFARAYCLRYSARIAEIRESGRVVNKEKLEGHSQWRYVLDAESDRECLRRECAELEVPW